MNFRFGVAIPVFPLGMKRVDKIKRPDEIRAGCAAPDCDRMILVSEFVEGVRDSFREFGFKYAHCRTKHLDSLKQDFVDMFIHHFFGGSSGIKRKDKQIHCSMLTLMLMFSLVHEFRLLLNYTIKFISISLLVEYRNTRNNKIEMNKCN